MGISGAVLAADRPEDALLGRHAGGASVAEERRARYQREPQAQKRKRALFSETAKALRSDGRYGNLYGRRGVTQGCERLPNGEQG